MESFRNICTVGDRKNEYRGVEREMGWVSLVNTNPLSPSLPLFVSSRSLSPPLPPSVVAKMIIRCKEKREGGVCVCACMSERETERYYTAYL